MIPQKRRHTSKLKRPLAATKQKKLLIWINIMQDKAITTNGHVMMECPLCGKTHCVEKKLQITHAIIKGEKIQYQECFFICGNSKLGENEFIPADVMDENLLAARNAYRMAHGMPSSSNKEL